MTAYIVFLTQEFIFEIYKLFVLLSITLSGCYDTVPAPIQLVKTPTVFFCECYKHFNMKCWVGFEKPQTLLVKAWIGRNVQHNLTNTAAANANEEEFYGVFFFPQPTDCRAPATELRTQAEYCILWSVVFISQISALTLSHNPHSFLSSHFLLYDFHIY